MTTSNAARTLHVTVLSANPETIDGLETYLRDAGVSSHSSRALGDAGSVPSPTTAIVLFPDEFEANDVIQRILALRARHPRLLLLVVTRTPQRLRPALDPDGHSALPVVLPKPAFGWSILDAIREHAKAEGGQG